MFSMSNFNETMALDADEDEFKSEQQSTMLKFLFGNVDENGQLENNVLSTTESKQLAAVQYFGANQFIHEMMLENEDDQNNNNNSKNLKESHCENEVQSCEDFSNISELIEENDDEEFSMEEESISKNENEEDLQNLDVSDEPSDDKKVEAIFKVPNSVDSKDRSDKNKLKSQFKKPLSSILPSKFTNIDITELFPEFRHNKVLRFSRLFGPRKEENVSRVWSKVKKRRKGLRNEIKDDEDHTSVEYKGINLNYGREPIADEIRSDDEEKLLRTSDDYTENKKIVESEKEKEKAQRLKVAAWRFGPARYWFDMLNVPANGEGFDYGFKLSQKSSDSKKDDDLKEHFSEDAFLMVSQVEWEKDVIWDAKDVKPEALKGAEVYNNDITMNCDAITKPVGRNSKLPMSQMKSTNHQNVKNKIELNQSQQEHSEPTLFSMFPVENEDLVYGLWEEDVIWDAENMDKIPSPKIFTLDPNDENIILGIPEDVEPMLNKQNTSQSKVKIANPHVKKSKLLLGKAGVINIVEDEAPPPPNEPLNIDPFNISNDEYYMPKSADNTLKLKTTGANLIQHSTPVVELKPLFIPTYLSAIRLRNFHRPSLKRFSRGKLSGTGHYPVKPLLKNIKKKAKEREQERIASGGGDVFFMRTPEDLTGCDGELVLVEFSEEHPPLMNEVGMCSKIKNYYKRMIGSDKGPPQYKYGETAYAHTSPFLGSLAPGKSLQTLENNMYRAPIYSHKVPETDFLVIRTRKEYFIREVDALFLAGQQCPLYEVPRPHSKWTNDFIRNFLQVYIFRLFWQSKDTPKRIKMEEVKKAFPTHGESTIRKRLKLCADFKRTGTDSNWWVMRPDFRLPTEEEMREKVTPEMCCAYFSMLAGEQRLKDAGYDNLIGADDNDNDNDQKAEDETLAAPWSTTRAYIQAVKGKCILQLAGIADPTGCGEGFSYVKMPNKPLLNKEINEPQQKRIVMGTDADLRKLSLNDAKNLLRKFGLPEEEIKKLSRWEVIAVVRTLSTEKAKAGEESITKFSRGNRFSMAEYYERYREECQRIFDLQNRMLASEEVLSTDDDENSNDSDIEEMGKNIETLLSNKKTSTQLSLEKEEQQRQELQKMLMNEDDEQSNDKQSVDESKPIRSQNRVLKIYRTFHNRVENKDYTRVEIVRNAAVIDAYLKIRNTKDPQYIKQFAIVDDAQKEEMKREKRRIQEQLRRIKRNEEKLANANQSANSSSWLAEPTSSSMSSSFSDKIKFSNIHYAAATPVSRKTQSPASSKRKKKVKPDLKVKCGACGNTGHMRTNKACPAYYKSVISGITLTPIQDQLTETPKASRLDDHRLINVDGTKVTLSSKLIKQAEEMKQKATKPKAARELIVPTSRKRRQSSSSEQCEYLRVKKREVNRRRTDPLVVLSSIFEGILNEMRDLPDVELFLFPVNPKLVPDYNEIIENPMDLQTIRENLRQKKYQNREGFLTDVIQIVENSKIYNGPIHPLTIAGQRMLDLCVQRIGEKEDKLMKLEKAINPLLDDNDQVAFTYILRNIVGEKLRHLENAAPFLRPVNNRSFKDYYDVIRNPMDLETIADKIEAHKYHTREDFLNDFKMIVMNAGTYNGQDAPITKQAEGLFQSCKQTLDEYDGYLSELEENIALTKQRMIDQIDTDTSSMGFDDYDGPLPKYPKIDHHFARESENSNSNQGFINIEGNRGIQNEDTLSLKTENVLAEDLQFSSEDEFQKPSTSKSAFNLVKVDSHKQSAISNISTDYNIPDSKETTLNNSEIFFNDKYTLNQELKPESEQSRSSFKSHSEFEDRVTDKIHADLEISASDQEMDFGKLTKETDKFTHFDEESGDLWF